MRNPAYAHCLREAARLSPVLREAMEGLGPVQMPSRPRMGLVRVLARAIVGQQISAAAARTIWHRIEVAAQHKGEGLTQFFRRERLLRRCGVSRPKARFLRALAERAGDLSAVRLKAMSHPERITTLTRLPGIGPWTCDMVGIFYCRDPNVWPAQDLALQRTFTAFTGIPKDKILVAVRPFVPYRSVLALMLWQLKKNLPQ